MKILTRFTRKHAVLVYFALTLIFTWGCMWFAASPGGFPLTEAQLETSGALVYVAMLIGPAGAGLLLTGLLDGRAGYRKLLSHLIRWRVSLGWYAVALLTAPTVITILLVGLSRFAPEFQPGVLATDEKLALVVTSMTMGLVVGFFEELGWTGFAIPRMKLHHSVLNTGLIVGLVWGIWHFPPFWKEDTFAATLPFILLLGQLFSWLPPYRILMVWVYDRTESLFLAILMHASLMGGLNALVPTTLTGVTLITWIFSWAIALWVVILAGRAVQRWRFSGQPVHKRVTS